MRLSYAICGLLMAVSFVHSSPIVKREAEDDLSPLNEVYVMESENDEAVDDDRTDRDKRKIGVVKLGVSNGIINFVFGKLDAFLDAKTKALSALDEGNKAANVAFGIDNTQSATSQFIGNFVQQKIQAGTGAIGPIVNGATTFLSSASSGLSNAFASKLAPLSSLSGGLSGGSGGAGGSGDGGSGLAGSGGILNIITSLSGSSSGGLSGGAGGGLSGGLSGGAGAGGNGGVGAGINIGGDASSSNGAGAGAGINLGAFANLGGGVTTTTESIPEFDRQRVSLDIPPQALGQGFTLITDVSKIVSNVITRSARRTQTILELFKPFFRGAFAIKGLPSDNP